MQYKHVIILLVSLLFLGCQEDYIPDAGSHYQNKDCLQCHNGRLEEEEHLRYGGTLYLDASSHPDDLSKICKEPVFVQFESMIDNSIIYDGRDDFSAKDSGALGKGNIYLKKDDGTVPSQTAYMRLILDNGTLVARSGVHSFSDAYTTINSADSANRYSCNACHSVSPNGGAAGLMVVNQNLSFCLEDATDVPVTTFFEADTNAILTENCASCHALGLDGANSAVSHFFLNSGDIASPAITSTRTNLLTASTVTTPEVGLINKNNPAASGLFTNCPADTNHTAGTAANICSQTGSDYQRILDWINLE
jgi:hypothetical protein